MKEHRGSHKKKLYNTNKQRVSEWLIKNPDKTMKDCGVELGLSYLTARKHIKNILSEIKKENPA